MNRKLRKEDIYKLLKTVDTGKRIEPDFIYDVYEIAFESILNLEAQNILKTVQSINSISLFYYIVGEYTYAIALKDDVQIDAFIKNDKIKIQMAGVVADKYASSELLEFKQPILGNKYLPPISSLDTYSNFMLSLLDKLPKNKPEQTLVIDLLNKSVSSLRCILKLLCEGFETEAMATWRTLHESECILILLDRYGDPLTKAYLKHMSYAIAFHGALGDVETTDKMFALLKSEMKEKDLKSKDMKKFIEYGWLYYTKESEDPTFKLNFRDGLETCAGLHEYSKIYEQSSEIVHSTPMLIYSNNVYYYLLTLLNTYESFFRIEKVFANYCFKGEFKNIFDQYNQMKSVYFHQLDVIYRNETARLKRLTEETLAKDKEANK